MLSKNQLKYLHSLRIGKYRDLNKSFIVEGIKMTDELIESNFGIRAIYGLASWYASREEVIFRNKIDFQVITEAELRKASSLVNPNAVLAVAAIPDSTAFVPDQAGDLVVLLDQIQDPGNLGTIIRTADWFGIKNIVCSPDTVDVYNPKVVQATMGSIFRVNVLYLDLKKIIASFSTKRDIIGTFPDGEDVGKAGLALPAALVIGNEASGISEEVATLLEKRVAIPSFSSTVESLNAAVAAGILCWELKRRG